MMIVKAVEVIAGLMILTGKYLPLGLILLAPVSVHGVPQANAKPVGQA
jgi:hypothetical protein